MAPVAGTRAGGRPGGDLETRAALALARAPGLGPVRFRRLVDRHGSALAALRALASAAARGEEPRSTRPAELRPVPSSRLAELRARGIRVLTYGARGYPRRLGDLHQPPPVLYLRGPLAPPGPRAVAVVGTRAATEYGRRVARRLGAELAEAGWTVVSGLARGIDAEAHRGALEAGGDTVGVLGSGLDHVYPAASRGVFRELARRGLLISEFEPERPPAPGHFPRRNRIIAALADAVVVVQAGERSGALLTVDHALDLGREVFAVPGPVDLAASVGTNGLLRDGARVVAGAGDVLAAFQESGARAPGAPGAGTHPGSDPAETALLAALRRGVEAADDLAAAARLEIAPALVALARLELRGVVRARPGGRFALAERG